MQDMTLNATTDLWSRKMIKKIRKKFTLWYIKKGYTFGYDFSETKYVYYDNKIVLLDQPKAVFKCPVWVKPFLIFFSPSIYAEIQAEAIVQGITEAMKKAVYGSSMMKEGVKTLKAFLELKERKEGAGNGRK